MRAIWSALKPTLLELLGSKKALAALSGVVVLIGSSVLSLFHVDGLEPDPAAVDRYLGLIAVYIVGQSVVDHGATAAQVKADNPVAVAPAVSVATTQSGTIEVKS